MKKKRLDFELMRILAIFLVVFNHTDTRGFFLYQMPGGSGVNCAVSLLLAVICKAAVPLFFMISGGLLLGREESLRTLLQKRILRMAAVLVLFSGILYLFWIHWGFVPHPGVKDFIKRLWGEGISIPYWYLYAYLGVLFLLPLLSPAAKAIPDWGYLWLFGIQLFLNGAVSILSGFTGLGILNQYFVTGLTMGAASQGTHYMAGQAVFYMLMGYYFVHRFHWEKLTGRRLFGMGILAAASVLLMAGLCWCDFRYHGNASGGYMGSFLSIVVFFLYIALHRIGEKIPAEGNLAKVIETLGGLVFGTYLLEGIYRRQLDGVYLALEPKIHVLPACLIWVAAVVVCGMATTWVLKKLPVLRKLL